MPVHRIPLCIFLYSKRAPLTRFTSHTRWNGTTAERICNITLYSTVLCSTDPRGWRRHFLQYSVTRFSAFSYILIWVTDFLGENIYHNECNEGGIIASLCHRKRIYTEAKAKVVAAVWGTEFFQILAAQAILHQVDLKQSMNS